MRDINSVKEAFRKLEDGDELTIETNYRGKRNNTVQKDINSHLDGLDERYRFGPAENCEIIVFNRENIQLKSIESDGSLEVNGKRIILLMNHDKEYHYSCEENFETGETHIGD